MIYISTLVYVEIARGQFDSLRLDLLLTNQFPLHCFHPLLTFILENNLMVSLQDELLPAVAEEERLRTWTSLNLYQILKGIRRMRLDPLF